MIAPITVKDSPSWRRETATSDSSLAFFLGKFIFLLANGHVWLLDEETRFGDFDVYLDSLSSSLISESEVGPNENTVHVKKFHQLLIHYYDDFSTEAIYDLIVHLFDISFR
ncbi:hypothetical protein Bca4012_024040 [Brassica carinata]